MSAPMLRICAPSTLALLLALGLLVPRSASACAACACGDPTLTVMGTGKNFGGRLRLSAEWRRRAETEAGTYGASRVTEDRFTAGAAWAPLDTLQLALTVPLVDRRLETATLARDRALNLGDVELHGRLFVSGARGRATHQLGLTAGLRLPTGPEMRGADGRPLPLDAQPGTGGFMPSVGAWYGLFAHPWSGHFSLNGVVATTGHGGFAPGPAALLTAFGQYQWGTALALRAGIDGRWTGRDDVRGATVAESGGPTLFAAGGVVVSIGEDTLLHGTLRWPVVDARRGGARSEPSLAAGVAHDL